MKKKKPTPPALAQRLLLRFLRDDLAEEVAGDLDEKFVNLARRKSAWIARLDYWYQVINYLRPFAIRRSRKRYFSGTAVLQSNLKISWRNLVEQKVFSSINIVGLAVGMASAVLILLWIADELSVDQFHEKKDRIYQVYSRSEVNGEIRVAGRTPNVLAPVLESDYTEVEEVIRINWVGAFVFHAGKNNVDAQGFFTDPGFFKVFSFALVKGNPQTALDGPRSIVITEKMAKKLFGDEEPMDKIVRIDSTALFKVTGVMANLPKNTQFNFDYLVPWSFMREVGWEGTRWDDYGISTIVLLKQGVTEQQANTAFHNILKKNGGDQKAELFLHGMPRWWLWSQFENGEAVGGGIYFIRLFFVIAGFILLIACINYMNLSTARSLKRGREIGISKVIGASRSGLISRFIIESVVIAFFSGALALLIVQLSLPWFNQLIDESLTIPFSSTTFWLYAVGFILLTGFLAGSYPAFHLSSFRILSALKGVSQSSASFFQPRRILVVVQFTFAIILITCTFIIYQQIRFGQNREAGFEKENLVYVYMQGDIKKNYEHIRRELLNSHAVTSVMKTNSPIIDVWNWDNDYTWEGKDPDKSESLIRQHTESDFVKTMGLKIIDGRDIDARTYSSDSSAVLLNESAVRQMGFTHPIGQTIQNREGTWQVVGVISDYVIGGPYAPAMPMVVHGPKLKDWFGTVTFRLNSRRPVSENIAKATAVFNTYNPEHTFTYYFIDEAYSSRIGNERVMGKLAALFAGLTIFISCLGLFALAAYTIEGRFKEIGVRKVLGASIVSITALLSKGFLKLVAISFVIASIIGWWSMEQWLQQYPYRVSIEWWMFAITGLLSIVISLLTVSFQSVKAALSNPVSSLKSE